MKKFFCNFVLFLLCALVFSQKLPGAFSTEAVKAFADWLYKDGFFDEAQREYKRYLYSGGTADEKVILPLLDIYNMQNNKSGLSWLKNSFYENSSITVKEKISLCQGRMLFLERNQKAFSTFYEEGEGNFSDFNPDLLNLFCISDFLLKEDFSNASIVSKEACSNNDIFNSLSFECENYSAKCPALALCLSSFIPGLGKLYDRNPSGFFTDFTSVGLCATAAVYTGMKTEWKDWRPYVFAGMGTLLFAVDLYGSFQNVKRVNAAKVRKICEEADKIYEKMY